MDDALLNLKHKRCKTTVLDPMAFGKSLEFLINYKRIFGVELN